LNFNRKPEKKPKEKLPIFDSDGRPVLVEVGDNEFEELLQRAREREIFIPHVTVKGTARWIVAIQYVNDRPLF